jgi:hypothetical protein
MLQAEWTSARNNASFRFFVTAAVNGFATESAETSVDLVLTAELGEMVTKRPLSVL